MATALDIIKTSMRLIGALDPSDVPTAAEMDDALAALNDLMASWSNESLAVYQIVQEGFPTVAGTASYTVGSGATWNTTRPLRIESAFLRYGSTDYPLRVLNREEYDQITLKTTQFMPEALHYIPAVANGTVTLYGVPDAVYTVYLNSLKALQSFAALTTTVVLPPGYQRMLRYNLALEIAPEYNRKVPDAVLAIARESKAAVKRLNSRTPKLRLDHLQLGGSTASDMAAFTAGY
jgi:hypothetical protein